MDTFRLGCELSDYGRLLYECDDSLGMYGASQQRLKAVFRNPVFYYFSLIIVMLVIWFVASLIFNIVRHGFLASIGMNIGGFITLFVISLIVFSSFGGVWSKLLKRLIGKKENKQEMVSIVENKRNAIQIYQDWLVITNLGIVEVYDIHMVEKVRLSFINNKKGYHMAFYAVNGVVKFAKVKIPCQRYMIIRLQKIFGDKLVVERPYKKFVIQTTKSARDIILPIAFVSLAIILGAGLIVMHYLVSQSVPIILGIFFIIGGVAAICGILDFIPILKDVVLPFLVCAVFFGFPYMILYTTYNANGLELTASRFFQVFNPIGVAVIFLGGLGLLFIIKAIKTLIEYIKYRGK